MLEDDLLIVCSADEKACCYRIKHIGFDNNTSVDIHKRVFKSWRSWSRSWCYRSWVSFLKEMRGCLLCPTCLLRFTCATMMTNFLLRSSSLLPLHSLHSKAVAKREDAKSEARSRARPNWVLVAENCLGRELTEVRKAKSRFSRRRIIELDRRCFTAFPPSVKTRKQWGMM